MAVEPQSRINCYAERLQLGCNLQPVAYYFTQLLYSLPLLINDISLLVSNDTNCWTVNMKVNMNMLDATLTMERHIPEVISSCT